MVVSFDIWYDGRKTKVMMMLMMMVMSMMMMMMMMMRNCDMRVLVWRREEDQSPIEGKAPVRG